jgi:hypothetical protein
MNEISIVDSKGNTISDVSDMVPSWFEGFGLLEPLGGIMMGFPNVVSENLCAAIAAKFPQPKHEFYYPNIVHSPRWFRVRIAHIDTFLGMSWAMKFFECNTENMQGFLFRNGTAVPDGKKFPDACAAARIVEEFFATHRYLSRDPASIVKAFVVDPLH